MTRFVLCLVVVVLGVLTVSSTQEVSIKEVIVLGNDTRKIIEQVTFGDSIVYTKPKIIKVEVNSEKKVVKPPSRRKTKRRRRLRRRCCEAGDLAAKHGMSCIIPTNFTWAFFNLTTRTRQKYQGKDKIRFRRSRHIYRRVSKCVKHHMKSAVVKCCKAYVNKQPRWRQG